MYEIRLHPFITFCKGQGYRSAMKIISEYSESLQESLIQCVLACKIVQL